MFERTAGPCKFLGMRHRWGKEQHMTRGLVTIENKQPCRDCNRWRVIAYTKGGNHIAGYFTR